MFNIRKIMFILIMICSTVFVSCNEHNKRNNFDIIDDVIVKNENQNIIIDSNIYVDATTSMGGFIGMNNSIFKKTLDALESSLTSGAKETKIKYYKFGTRIKDTTRKDLITNLNSEFFSDPEVFKETRLDSVFYNLSESKSHLIVTDLFQSDGDINCVINAIKEKCFEKNFDLGFIQIGAQFKGKIYDAGTPYFYDSKDNVEKYKNFYIIFIGKAPIFERIIQSLKSSEVKDFFNDDSILLYSKAISDQFIVEISKGKSQNWSPVSISGKYKNVFKTTCFNEKDNLMGSLTINKKQYLPNLNLQSVKTECYEIIDNKELKMDENPFSISSVSPVNDNTINFELKYQPHKSKQTTVYKLYFILNSFDSFVVNKSYLSASSDNPSINFESNKTLNLSKFINSVNKTYSISNKNYIAKAYMIIQNK